MSQSRGGPRNMVVLKNSSSNERTSKIFQGVFKKNVLSKTDSLAKRPGS
jgi:hypothetical protein